MRHEVGKVRDRIRGSVRLKIWRGCKGEEEEGSCK